MSESGSICGGGHMAKTWAKKEAVKHMINEPCIDCYAGIGFKARKKGYVWQL